MYALGLEYETASHKFYMDTAPSAGCDIDYLCREAGTSNSNYENRSVAALPVQISRQVFGVLAVGRNAGHHRSGI